MTAHDPRVTLTEAIARTLAVHRRTWIHDPSKHRSGMSLVVGMRCSCGWDTHDHYAAEALHREHVAGVTADIFAARLAPIRALADEWETKYGTCGGPTNGGEQLRAALDATGADLSASQDHDGAEGQGEGEKPADRRCPTCGIPFAHYTHDPQGRPL